MRRLKFALAAGLLASLPLSAAHAGWYVGADGGVSFAEDAESNSSANDTSYDVGPVLLGQAGYNMGAISLEGELGWRNADIDSVGNSSAGGDINVYSVMGNVIYNFTNLGALRPFVGAGIGTAYVDTSASVGGAKQYDGDDWTLAYQLFAGAAYDITDNWSLKGQYRYFDTTEFNTDTSNGSGKFDPDFRSHSVLVGFSYAFDAPAAPAPAPAPVAAPAPAPAPAPVAAPPSNYLVFFDWNQSSITPVAHDIIVKAANAAQTGKKARIDLTGHTDRSGTDTYNLKLSMARAEAVKAELASLGIAADIVTVTAKGESDPLVKTDDGIREPQNRRVEIIIP